MKEVKISIRKKVEKPFKVLMAVTAMVLGVTGVFLTFLSTRNTLQRNLPVLAEFASTSHFQGNGSYEQRI